MSKWADYLISEVEYDSNYHISKIKQHHDNGETIGDGEIVDRDTLANNLGHGTLNVPPGLQLRLPPRSILATHRSRLEQAEEHR